MKNKLGPLIIDTESVFSFQLDLGSRLVIDRSHRDEARQRPSKSAQKDDERKKEEQINRLKELARKEEQINRLKDLARRHMDPH